jgi:dipeptidyl-peptidase-4
MGFYELQDQLEGVEYLKSLEYIDSTRIGIWGWSYGGYMVLNALTKASDVFKTGIAVAPVTNWKFYDSIYTERYMGLPEGNSVGYYKSSPLNFVENIKSNFLLVHGTGDDNVHFQNSTAFIDELIKYNKHFELMIYPGRKHGISDKEASIHLYEKMTEFTEKNL